MTVKEYLKLCVGSRGRRMPTCLRPSWVTCEFHTRLELSQKGRTKYLNIILEGQIISLSLLIN